MERRLVSQPRILGVDYGTRRVGLAMADPLGLFAHPVGTFTPEETIKQIRAIDAEDGVSCLVVGWPLTLEGREAEAAVRVQTYIDRLNKVFPHIPIEKMDERFSSRRASEALVEAGVRKKARRQKGRIDSAAAALILQDYLDERSAQT